MKLFPPLSAFGILLLAACSGGHQTPTPKPEAYPRIEMPDSVFRTVSVNGTDIAVNSGAVAKIEEKENGDSWITVTYPSFGNVTLYLTLSNATPEEPAESILANRRERMSLNLSGAESLLTTLVSTGGWECEMLSSRSSLSTPVQILASKDGKVMSGTMYLHISHTTPADSVSPVIDAVERDMLTMLKAL